MKKYIGYLLMLGLLLGSVGFEGCKKATCPANNNGMIDKPKKVNPKKKPKSGLWGPDMKK